MDHYLGKLPSLALAVLGLWAQWRLCGWIRKKRASSESAAIQWLISVWFWIGSAWLLLPFLWTPVTWDRYLSQMPTLMMVRGAAFSWAIAMVVTLIVVAIAEGSLCVLGINRKSAEFDPARRRLLNVARAGAVVAPLGAVSFGVIVERSQFRMTQVDIEIPNLPPDLDQLRLVQLSDIHLSAYLTERELDRAVDMANETRADLALVTGDLITFDGGRLTTCLDRLRRLRVEGGVYGCPGES